MGQGLAAVSTSGEGGLERRKQASLPGMTWRKRGRCSLPWPAKVATNQHPLPCERPASDKSLYWNTASVLQGAGSVCPGSSGAGGLLPPLCMMALSRVCLPLQGMCNSQYTHPTKDLC